MPGLEVPSTTLFYVGQNGQDPVSAFAVSLCDAITKHASMPDAGTLVLVVPSLRNTAEVFQCLHNRHHHLCSEHPRTSLHLASLLNILNHLSIAKIRCLRLFSSVEHHGIYVGRRRAWKRWWKLLRRDWLRKTRKLPSGSAWCWTTCTASSESRRW